MNIAARALKALDDALARVGRTIVLRRISTGSEGQLSPSDCSCAAVVQAIQPSDASGVSDDAPDTQIILSPTQLLAAQWPGPDERPLPRRHDRVVIDDEVLIIDQVSWRDIGGTIVRIELACRNEGGQA